MNAYEKMRHAVEVAIRDLKSDIDLSKTSRPNARDFMIKYLSAALAAPRRNCDVGTAEEQENRFRRYCNSRGTFCGDCPLYKNRRGECRFAWAQMPYKEGGEE